jgi:hypothetical protein
MGGHGQVAGALLRAADHTRGAPGGNQGARDEHRDRVVQEHLLDIEARRHLAVVALPRLAADGRRRPALPLQQRCRVPRQRRVCHPALLALRPPECAHQDQAADNNLDRGKPQRADDGLGFMNGLSGGGSSEWADSTRNLE